MKIKKQVTVETEISLPAILKRSVKANTFDIIHAYFSENAERIDVISVSGGAIKSVAFGQKAEDWGHLFDGDVTECSSSDVIIATREAESILIGMARNAELIENRGIIKAAIHRPPAYGPMKPKVTERRCASCKFYDNPEDDSCIRCGDFSNYKPMEEPTDE